MFPFLQHCCSIFEYLKASLRVLLICAFAELSDPVLAMRMTKAKQSSYVSDIMQRNKCSAHVAQETEDMLGIKHTNMTYN